MKTRSADSRAAQPRFSGSAGLTLLEVLFALAILGMGLAVIMQGISLGLKVRRDSAESQRVAFLAENLLNRIMLMEKAPSKDEEGEEEGLRWRLTRDEGIALAGSGEGEEGGAERLAPLRIVVESASGRTWEFMTLMWDGGDKLTGRPFF